MMSFFDWKTAPKLDLTDLKKSDHLKRNSSAYVKKRREQGFDPGKIHGLSKKADARLRDTADFA